MDNRDERYLNPARYHSASCIHMHLFGTSMPIPITGEPVPAYILAAKPLHLLWQECQLILHTIVQLEAPGAVHCAIPAISHHQWLSVSSVTATIPFPRFSRILS